VNGVSCCGDPAAYGLETAHHGPDAGEPGRGDGCYQTTGAVPPARDVASPRSTTERERCSYRNARAPTTNEPSKTQSLT